MTPLPIFGQGNQPPEQGGAALDYLQMPQDMAAFPTVCEPNGLTRLDADNRKFADELLREGEVSVPN